MQLSSSLWSLLIILLYFINNCFCTVDINPKTYEIDISKPANEYLQPICRDLGESSKLAFNRMSNIIPPQIARKFRPMAWNYWMSNEIKEPYKSEIQYISECLSIPIKDMILINLVYEFMPACTSIVLSDARGQIIHGRNQDFPTILRDTVFNAKYTKSGSLLFEGTSFFGYVGIPTGIKYGAFSITMNARVSFDYWNNLKAINDFWFPSGWLPREALIHDSNFKQAVVRLRDTPIMSDIYYIIAGINNGVVVSRDVKSHIKMDWLRPPKSKLISKKKWYIIETNYDDWKEGMDTIIEGKKAAGRRRKAIQLLNRIGRENINKKQLYKILSTPPILAEDTAYTTIFSPSDSAYYNTKIRKKTPLEGVGLNKPCKKSSDCVNARWDVACCNGQCKVKLFDYVGLKAFCPNKCKACSFCLPGSCSEMNKKIKDQNCQYHEQCIGHGIYSDDMACCWQPKVHKRKCTKKEKDYTGKGIGWCPNQCKAGVGCPAGTCPTNGKQKNEPCKCHEQCQGHGLRLTAMACCHGVCKQKRYGFCPRSAKKGKVIVSNTVSEDVFIIWSALVVMFCVFGFVCGISAASAYSNYSWNGKKTII
eukprot:337049_1